MYFFLSAAKFILSAVTQCNTQKTIFCNFQMWPQSMTSQTLNLNCFWMLILISWTFFGMEKWYLPFILIFNNICSQYIIAPYRSYSTKNLFSSQQVFLLSPLLIICSPKWACHTICIINYPSSFHWWCINIIRIFIRGSKLIGNRLNLLRLGKRWFLLSHIYKALNLRGTWNICAFFLQLYIRHKLE